MKWNPHHLLVVLVCSLAVIIGCSTSGSQTTITGTVFAPNGIDPVPGADVYVPVVGEAQLQAMALAPQGEDVFGSASTALVKTKTGPDGSFVLEGVGEGTVPVVVSSGFFKKRLDLTVEAGATAAVPEAMTTLPATSGTVGEQTARFAVVTGDWDQMEDVLAKFGMGQTDSHGALVVGTQAFDIYRSAPSRMVWDEELADYGWEDWPLAYPAVDDLFADLATMQSYDVIVINCGVTPAHLLTNEAVRGRIHDFVLQGGRLYVTDRNYDYIEQVFPNYIRFQYGEDISPSTPEPIDFAEAGYCYQSEDPGGEGNWDLFTTNGSLLDQDLSSWLANLGDVLNPDGSVHLEDFLYRWAVMVGPHVGTIGNQCKVWVEAPVKWYSDPVDDLQPLETGIRPLTVSFHYGQGKVIYTSYHTAGEPHAGFLPQERILEYLLLESAR